MSLGVYAHAKQPSEGQDNRYNVFFKDELPRLNDNGAVTSIRAFIILE